MAYGGGGGGGGGCKVKWKRGKKQGGKRVSLPLFDKAGLFILFICQSSLSRKDVTHQRFFVCLFVPHVTLSPPMTLLPPAFYFPLFYCVISVCVFFIYIFYIFIFYSTDIFKLGWHHFKFGLHIKINKHNLPIT